MAAAQLRHLQCLASRLVGTRASGRVGGFIFSTVQRASHRATARTSWAAVAVPAWQGCRPLTVSAVDEGRAGSSSGAAAAAAAADYGEQADLQLPTHCSGCGVELQQADPKGPGFFQVPKRLLERRAAAAAGAGEEEEEEFGEFAEDDSEIVFDDVGPEAYKEAAAEGEGEGEASTSGRDPEQDSKWAAFDSMVEGWLGGSSQQPRVEVQSYGEQEEGEGAAAGVRCARCYSLVHYGSVKSAAAESEMPDFDFERKVGLKIQLQKFRRSVVLMVVDVADFDGSLPREAIRSILPPDMREGPLDVDKALPLGFRLLVAVNKADLLPKQVTPARLEKWVRKRMAQGGLPRPSAVHIVSSTKQRGVRELLADLQSAVGLRGDVWVVGAQNAGKSSLINAMRQAAKLPKDNDVTTAPLPGTTLGMLRVSGLLPTGCKMLDTPGVPHPHQLAGHLTAEEMRMVLPRRQLKPRTFRIGKGQTVMIGGLARVDVVDHPGATLYLNVFASDEVGCHLGKTEGADERYRSHAGGKLAPPLGGPERLAGFPALVPTDVTVQGDSWKASSMDVAIAGLGWVAVGVAGAASLRVWAPPGVAVTTHDALVPDFSRDLERPGFGLALTDAGKDKQGEEARLAKAAEAAAAKEAKKKERLEKQERKKAVAAAAAAGEE